MQKAVSFLIIASLSTSIVFAATGSNTSTPTPLFSQSSNSTSLSLGENKSVSCSSNSAFGTNSCDECFDGGSVTVGKRLTGLFDNWTNNTT